MIRAELIDTPRRRPVIVTEVREARRLTGEGMPRAKVALRLERDRISIWRWTRDLRTHGSRRAYRWTDDLARRLLSAADEGVPYADLASRFGLANSNSVKTTICMLRKRRAAAEARP